MLAGCPAASSICAVRTPARYGPRVSERINRGLVVHAEATRGTNSGFNLPMSLLRAVHTKNANYEEKRTISIHTKS